MNATDTGSRLGRPGGTTWVGRILAWEQPTTAADVAVTVARLALAWTFVYYGAGKLFGAFGGPGLDVTGRFMADTAHLHPGGLFALLAGLIELGGAIAMALGLATRLAGLALFVDMVMATLTVTASRGIETAKVPPGYGLNLALGVLALVVALLGAGRYSLDARLEPRLTGRS